MSKVQQQKKVVPPITQQQQQLQPPSILESKLSVPRRKSNASQKSQSVEGQPTEMDILLASRFETFILKPKHIAKVWNSSHMKEDIILIFQDHFKPKSSLEQEKVEYNEINIFAEFQLHNLIYSKNELLFNDYKTAVLLNVFWKLLEFNVDSNIDIEIQQEQKPSRVESERNNLDQVEDEDPAGEQHFANLLSRKFTLFKQLLFETLNEPEKALLFSAEQVKRIADYAKDSFFKHLRLYDYVLNNKQLCEVKRIHIQVNEPIISTTLNDALLLGSEEALGYEDEDEELRLEIIRKKQELAEQRKLEEELRQKQLLEAERGEESDEDLRGVDDRLKHSHLDKESKLIIHNKMTKMDSALLKTLDDKQKALDEKLQGGKKK